MATDTQDKTKNKSVWWKGREAQFLKAYRFVCFEDGCNWGGSTSLGRLIDHLTKKHHWSSEDGQDFHELCDARPKTMACAACDEKFRTRAELYGHTESVHEEDGLVIEEELFDNFEEYQHWLDRRLSETGTGLILLSHKFQREQHYGCNRVRGKQKKKESSKVKYSVRKSEAACSVYVKAKVGNDGRVLVRANFRHSHEIILSHVPLTKTQKEHAKRNLRKNLQKEAGEVRRRDTWDSFMQEVMRLQKEGVGWLREESGEDVNPGNTYPH